LATVSATAQNVIFDENFSGSFPVGTSSYQGGAPSATSSGVQPTGGNPGGTYVESMTTTTWGDYFAGQLQFYLSGNTDPNAADYTLSFDAMGSQAGPIQMAIQSWQNIYFGGSQIDNFTLSSNPTLGAANTWQTFSINLGSLAGFVPTGVTWQLNFQLNSWLWNGPNNTDTLSIDNIVLTQVPEPATMTLLLLGGAGALRAWRKQS
jgi:hypothetical protein